MNRMVVAVNELCRGELLPEEYFSTLLLPPIAPVSEITARRASWLAKVSK